MKFRHKPTVVEAIQFDSRKYPWPEGVINYHGNPSIITTSGMVILEDNDWIITNPIDGSKYRCSGSVFKQLYEQVADE